MNKMIKDHPSHNLMHWDFTITMTMLKHLEFPIKCRISQLDRRHQVPGKTAASVPPCSINNDWKGKKQPSRKQMKRKKLLNSRKTL